MKKKTSRKKQQYISKYTNEAYITYQFRLRKTKDQTFIREIAEYIKEDGKQPIKRALLESLIKKHIHSNANLIYDGFVKLLFIELENNKHVKLDSFWQIIQLFNYGFIDQCALDLILEQFDAKISFNMHEGQYNKYFFDNKSFQDSNYVDYVKNFDKNLERLIKGKEKIDNLTVNNIVPIMETYKINRGK